MEADKAKAISTLFYAEHEPKTFFETYLVSMFCQFLFSNRRSIVLYVLAHRRLESDLMEDVSQNPEKCMLMRR